MRTITALFDDYDHAASAVRALRDIGVDSADISIVANNTAGEITAPHEETTEGATAGAGVGAVAGGGAGLLAGLDPGGAGHRSRRGRWLVACDRRWRAGRRCRRRRRGGPAGALANAGVPEADAHVYAEGVRRGGAWSASAPPTSAPTRSPPCWARPPASISMPGSPNFLPRAGADLTRRKPPYSEEQIPHLSPPVQPVPPPV